LSEEAAKEDIMVTINKWIDNETIEIDKDRVCHNLGYNAGHKLNTRISSLLDGYVEHAHHLIEPAYSYVIRDIERIRRSCVFVEGSVVFESKVIAQLLSQCTKVAVFTATIGESLEEMVIHLSKDGLILQSAVLDAIGSVAVDNLAEFVEDKIRELAQNQGLTISRRFSPGYCDWTIRQQKEVFRIVDGSSAGIRLTGGCLMIPKKSISGIIGIGPSDMAGYNPCKTCKKHDCLGRRI
jgi:hypothetical protein